MVIGIRDRRSGIRSELIVAAVGSIAIHIDINTGLIFARLFALEVIDVAVEQALRLRSQIVPRYTSKICDRSGPTET